MQGVCAMGLLSTIEHEIKACPQAAISFARFMELALYHPEYGYYTSSRPKVGKEGDFFTSATVHPVFAETLADVIAEMCIQGGYAKPTLVEAGGGTGYLMKYITARLAESYPELAKKLRLLLIEASPYHRELQAEALADFSGEKKWYASIEEAAKSERIDGVLLSNEWFDAFPVHLVEKTKTGWQEVWVAWDDKTNRPLERLMPQLSERLQEYLDEIDRNLPVGMRVELNLAMRGALKAISTIVRSGYVITIDYGDTREALYHPSRRRGTLMCYHKHQASENPYVNVGEQDITAHVDFSALIGWGEEYGLQPLALLRQDQFLLQSGILTKLQEHSDRDPFTSSAMKRNRAIRQLIEPSGMGGTFRVLVQGKEVPDDLPLAFLQKPTFL